MRLTVMRLAALAVLATVAAGCSGASSGPEAQAERFEPPASYLAAAPDDPVVPLSYLIKQRQVAWAADSAYVWQDLIDSCSVAHPIDARDWTTSDMHLTVGAPNGTPVKLTFTKVGWDPDHTDITYGPVTRLKSVDKTFAGAGFLILLSGSEEPLSVDQTQTVTEDASRSTTFENETHFDIGSETTVGGSGFGISAEQKFSAAFGEKFDTTKQQSESTDHSVEKHIEYEAEPQRDTLLLLTTDSSTYRGALTVTGTPEWTVKAEWDNGGIWQFCQGPGWGPFHDPHNAGLRCHNHKCAASWTLTEMQEMLSGVNTDWSGMADYKPGYVPLTNRGDSKFVPVKPHIDNLFDPGKRHIEWHGEQTYSTDGIVDITVTDVTGQDPDAVQRQYGLNDDQVLG